MKFDLITIGQAYHWFDGSKFINFTKTILDKNGILCILGYKKQHFRKEHFLFEIFENFINLLKPYFECDVEETDSAFPNSQELFKQNFKNFEIKYFEEKIEINLDFFISFLKSWSGYVNFIKKNKEKDDPLLQFRKNCEIKLKEKFCKNHDYIDFGEIKFDFYNFYFVILLKDLI